MWTPRRVLFLILGMVLFGAAFGVYARFLGWIDGLPELPDELLVRRAVDERPVDLTATPIEARLQQAFGPGCLEARRQYTIQLEFPSKGLLLAAGEFGIDGGDGRVRLAPFSLATFKERPGQPPEITTIHCDVAYLELDRPVRSVAEMNNRRIVACELDSDPQAMSDDPRRGKVLVINNRGTETPDDDLVLETPGPVMYRESPQPNLPLDKAPPQLKTAAAVKLIDRRHQPDATTIDAQGMEVYLSVDPPESAAAAAKKPKVQGAAVSGVRRVVLPANVRMNLWMDPNEGFLATGAKPQTAKPQTGPAKPAEPSHVLITTLGPFTYDVLPEGDRARFERLPPAATQLPNCVRVVRPQVRGPDAQFNDQLECDVLEMHFAQKPAKPPTGPQAPPRPKTQTAQDDDRQALDWVHAWGQFIILTSDEEKLEARGNDLVYNARTKATTLKGIPEMVAVKDGNEIHTGELTLYGAEAKEGRHAEAPGAGRFRLVDRTGTRRTVEARWRDQMIYRQEDGRDLLTLSGDAAFDDRENEQMLAADQLKLLLAGDPKPPSATPAAAPAAKDAPPKLHPQRLEATGHVTARSPDLNIRHSEQLVLLFKDLPAATAPPPAAGAGNSPWTTPVAPPPPPGGLVGPPAPQRKQPIDLAARTVQAFINRQGEQNLLDVVHCEGEVRVHQDPVPPQEKPVDMRGRALKLKHTNDGNILTVTGTVAAPGEVHTPDLSLIGPFIVIDQVENVAEVQGLGSMRMVSTTDFEGKKLKEPTPLTVYWKQGMKFTGQHARFHGFVQADQQDTTLLCQTMQVYLNRAVSLSQRSTDSRGPDKEAANVDKVVCEAGERPQGVIITETIHEDGRLKSTKQLEADEVAIYKDEGRMDAANHRNGRGNVRIVQLGPKGDPGGPKQPAAGPPKPQELEYKLTWVRYNGIMKVNNQSHTADFYDGVELLHLPLEAADRVPAFDATVNKLPTGALHLTANKMTVYSAKDAADQTRQLMEAQGRARITWGNDFYGTADVIRFDEAKQQMTMTAANGGYATAKRFTARPNEPAIIRAQKIVYIRGTDQFYSDGVYSVGGN